MAEPAPELPETVLKVLDEPRRYSYRRSFEHGEDRVRGEIFAVWTDAEPSERDRIAGDFAYATIEVAPQIVEVDRNPARGKRGRYMTTGTEIHAIAGDDVIYEKTIAAHAIMRRWRTERAYRKASQKMTALLANHPRAVN